MVELPFLSLLPLQLALMLLLLVLLPEIWFLSLFLLNSWCPLFLHQRNLLQRFVWLLHSPQENLSALVDSELNYFFDDCQEEPLKRKKNYWGEIPQLILWVGLLSFTLRFEMSYGNNKTKNFICRIAGIALHKRWINFVTRHLILPKTKQFNHFKTNVNIV